MATYVALTLEKTLSTIRAWIAIATFWQDGLERF